MVEIRKKKRAPPPPTTKVADAQQNVHAKTASVGSMDSGISGGNKSPPESVKSTKITAKKKRAPLPPPVMAKKLSLTRGAVRLPSAGTMIILYLFLSRIWKCWNPEKFVISIDLFIKIRLHRIGIWLG